MVFAYLSSVLGIVVILIVFKMIKEDYSLWEGMLAIVAAILAGNFWLNNKNGKQEMHLLIKLFFIMVFIFFSSLTVILLFYGFSNFLSFYHDFFFIALLFSVLMCIAFYLKNKVVQIYDELIFTLVYICEPLLLYFYWEIAFIA